MALSEYLPFATQANANVISQSVYETSPWAPVGFVAGIAQSAQFNKVWRQSSFVTAAFMQLIPKILNEDALDDGDRPKMTDQIERLIGYTARIYAEVNEAPSDGQTYGRRNGAWTPVINSQDFANWDAPPGAWYVRQGRYPGGGWANVNDLGFLTDAPAGAHYVRTAGQWVNLDNFGFATQSWTQNEINTAVGGAGGPYLPISGGTLTGPGNLAVGNGTEIANFSVPRGSTWLNGEVDITGTCIGYGFVSLVDMDCGNDLRVIRNLDIVLGDLSLQAGTAVKPGGGPFDPFSDSRTKAWSAPYERGLEVITKLEPVSYRYNGKAHMPTDKTFVGLIADDVLGLMPEIVGHQAVDGERYMTIEAGPVTWALVNCVKQLNREVAKLREALYGAGDG